MSKPFRRLVYAIMTLAMLVTSSLAIVSSSWFRRVLERRVAAKLQEVTGARVEIGQMGFNPLILEMTFHPLILHGTEDAAQPSLFTARSVAVRLHPISILRRKLVIARLDITGAEAHLATGRDGLANLPGPAPSSRATAASSLQDLVNLTIGRLTVSQTNIFFNDQRVPLEVSAQNVAVQLQRKRRQGYAGSLSSTALRVDSPRIALPATTLSSRFEISQSGLNVTSLEWHTKGLSGQSTLQLTLVPETKAHVTFKAAGTAADAARILKLGQFSSGDVLAEGHADYTQGTWQSQGRVQGRQIRPSPEALNSGPIDFAAEYSADRDRIQAPDVRVSMLGGTFQGKGSVSLSEKSPQYSLHAELRGVHLSAALASVSGSRPLLKYLHWGAEVRGTTDTTWTGNFENLNCRFDLRFQTRAGAPIGSFPVNGIAQGSATNAHGLTLRFDSLNLRTPHSNLSAKGSVQSSQSQLDVELVTSDFEEWRVPVEYLARAHEPIPLVFEDPVTFSGSLGGSLNQPAIRGRLSARKFDYRGWSWDELEAGVLAAPHSVEISGGRLRSERSVLTVDAAASLEDWQLDPNGPARFSAGAERTPLAGLKAALGVDYDITGLVTGNADLKGTAASMTGAGNFKVDQGTVAGQPFDSLAADFHVAESVWTVANIHLARGKARVTGRGNFNPSSRAFSADLQGTDISLADFNIEPSPERQTAAKKKLEGEARFNLKGQGTPESVQLRADWDVRDFKVMGTAAGGLHGGLTWQNQTLRITGESAGEGGSLHFQGEAQTQGDWPMTLSGNYSNFFVSPWIRLLLSSKLDAQVKANGDLKVHGPLREPAKLEVESRIDTLEVDTSNLAWKNSQPVELRYANRRLNLSRFSIQGPATNLEVKGSIRFGQRSTVALTAQGESDATLLSLLDPAIKATGRTKMDLRISGTPAQPRLFGTLAVQDFNLAYGELPFHLSGMNGEIRLEGERATVSSLRGMSGGGAVTVQGFMTFAEMPRFQLSVKVDQVRVQYPVDFTSQLTGTLRLNGSSENSRLEGDLIVRQMFAAPNFSVLNLMSEVSNPAGTLSMGTSSPAADSIRLNVQVFSAPTVRLETQDLRMVADVDLHLQGTLANPVVVGSIHVLNGETVLRGNRYKVSRADINMTNPFRTQPVLDVEATTRVQTYDLTLDISGPLDQVKIAYRSDPPLPTSDVLSLLALGYSRQQGGLSTTGQESFSTVGASALLSEALSSQMTGRIQRLFGVSRIKIDPNSGGLENVAGARVTVEQQVTRELTLTYITDTGSSQRRVVQFEWQVGENVSLYGVRDRNGIFGVELKFRRRFQ